MFVAPRDGLSSLVDVMAAKLPAGCVRLNCAVRRIDHVNREWRVVDENGSQKCDGLIVATSATTAANLLARVNSTLANELAAIEYAGSAVVALGYERSQIARPLDSFGFVVPAIERRRILSASFASVKFPGRAPAGKELIRVFLGGALQPEVLEHTDDQLRQIAEDELQELLGITGGPCLSMVFRWSASMPQYHLGHLDRVRQINEKLSQLPGIALAGNAYTGVGIPQCVRSGEQAAERLICSGENCSG